MDPHDEEDYALAGLPGITKVLRLHTQDDIDMFLAGEERDAAVLGYFALPSTADELGIFKEVYKPSIEVLNNMLKY